MSIKRTEDWKYNLDAHAYFDTFYNCTSSHYRYREYMKDVVQTYHEVFDDGTITGHRCLDFGCGPTIHCSITLSRWFDQIHFADFPQNVNEITKWINRSPNALDWSYFFEEYARLEGTSAEHVERRFRSKIGGSIPYTKSLLDDDSWDPEYEEKFDLILVNHVLQAICTNMETYTEALKKLGTFLTPGGHLCVVDPLGETFSLIGQKKFEMYPLVYEEVMGSLEEAGFNVTHSVQKSFKNKDKYFVDSCKWHMTIAKKL